MQQDQFTDLLTGMLHGDAESVRSSIAAVADELERLGFGDSAARFRALLPTSRELADAVSAACGEAQEAYELSRGPIGYISGQG